MFDLRAAGRFPNHWLWHERSLTFGGDQGGD
jgi:hypothetical protein